MKVVNVVGARPNFIKIAPLMEAYGRRAEIEPLLVHTGQHYDERMSASFFEALGIPRPDIDLGVGSGTHAEQVGRTMIEFERVLREVRPDWVVVVGDVNATCACSITAKKEHVKLAHVEAGLRSFDLDMPEEINRMVTDRLADLLFTTDELADRNLRREGVPEERIKLVGNVMIDSLLTHRDRAAALPLDRIVSANSRAQAAGSDAAALREDRYAVLTLHRPSNVDCPDTLAELTRFFVEEIAADLPLVWPVHPRTAKQLRQAGLWDRVSGAPGVVLLHPIGYLEMLRLNLGARIMLTDSGGLQEECCALGTPCLTLRENTERPVTITQGSNQLVGCDPQRIVAAASAILDQPLRTDYPVPELWDGRSAERLVAVLRQGVERR